MSNPFLNVAARLDSLARNPKAAEDRRLALLATAKALFGSETEVASAHGNLLRRGAAGKLSDYVSFPPIVNESASEDELLAYCAARRIAIDSHESALVAHDRQRTRARTGGAA